MWLTVQACQGCVTLTLGRVPDVSMCRWEQHWWGVGTMEPVQCLWDSSSACIFRKKKVGVNDHDLSTTELDTWVWNLCVSSPTPSSALRVGCGNVGMWAVLPQQPLSSLQTPSLCPFTNAGSVQGACTDLFSKANFLAHGFVQALDNLIKNSLQWCLWVMWIWAHILRKCSSM